MEFDKEKYRIYTWRNWNLLIWFLNPVSWMSELFFGRKVPKIIIEDITIDKSKSERIFIPCPHCQVIHDGRTWSPENGTAYKNWFGLYCPNCGKVIHCLPNLFSYLILMLTPPIWGWFRKGLKAKWLGVQSERYQNIDIKHIPNAFSKKQWARTALFWGFFMFMTMAIFFPYIEGKDYSWKILLLNFVYWMLVGLGYGYIMKRYTQKRLKKQ